MSCTKVKNVNGSGRFNPPLGYSSWLEYWERKTGKRAYNCGALGCFGNDLVGAHVQIADAYDVKWYVTPLCRSCNNRTDEFYVLSELVPVPSNL